MERLASNVAGFGQQGYGAGMGTSGALTSGGQQLYGMGTGASSALSGLAGQLAGGQQTGAGAMQGYGGSVEKGGKPIPEGNKGLAALSKKAPDVVRKMGFSPAKAMHGGIASRFPMTSRKMRTG